MQFFEKQMQHFATFRKINATFRKTNATFCNFSENKCNFLKKKCNKKLALIRRDSWPTVTGVQSPFLSMAILSYVVIRCD